MKKLIDIWKQLRPRIKGMFLGAVIVLVLNLLLFSLESANLRGPTLGLDALLFAVIFFLTLLAKPLPLYFIEIMIFQNSYTGYGLPLWSTFFTLIMYGAWCSWIGYHSGKLYEKNISKGKLIAWKKALVPWWIYIGIALLATLAFMSIFNA